MIHRQLQQVDQLMCLWAEERSTEDEARLGIDDSLQQAVRLAKDLRLGDSHGLQSLDFIGATRASLGIPVTPLVSVSSLAPARPTAGT